MTWLCQPSVQVLTSLSSRGWSTRAVSPVSTVRAFVTSQKATLWKYCPYFAICYPFLFFLISFLYKYPNWNDPWCRMSYGLQVPALGHIDLFQVTQLITLGKSKLSNDFLAHWMKSWRWLFHRIWGKSIWDICTLTLTWSIIIQVVKFKDKEYVR